MATTESIPTAARGVDTNGLRHLYQGSVGESKATGILVLKVHTGSLTFTLFILCHCLVCLYFATV